MISVEEAERIIMSHVRDYGVEVLTLPDAYGAILREKILADRPMPPYHRVTMDGICIKHEAYLQGRRQFEIAETVAAGHPQATLFNPESCHQIMTGAVLSKGADTVIRYEDLSIEDKVARIQSEDVIKGQNVHTMGSDRAQGSIIIEEGKPIGAAEINVLATVGHTQVKVSRPPSMMLISTGDELVDIDRQPLSHQIRRSNTIALYTALRQFGGKVDVRHHNDDKSLLKEKLNNYLEEYEVLILSGGVSKGKFDFVPEILDLLGVQKLFHKVMQRPGKPFWFGKHPGGTLVFALPGNPVSSFVCTFRYFIPWLYACLRHSLEEEYALLAESVQFSKNLTYFAQVLVYNDTGSLRARHIKGNGSGDLANMVNANAFMELPKEKTHFAKGESYRIYRY